MAQGGYAISPAQKAEDDRVLREIVQRLNADVDTLVPRLLPGAVRDGKYWAVGNLDGAKGSSLKINRVKNVGWWKDFSADGPGSSGDMLKLVAIKLHGGDLGAAIRDLRQSMGLVHLTAEQVRRLDVEAAARQKAADEQAAKDAAGVRDRASALWHGARDDPTPGIAGTPGQAYFEGRGIDFSRLGRIPGSLRYRPDVWCPVRAARVPAIIACIIAADGSLAGVHRTYLDISGWNHATRTGRVLGVKVAGHGEAARIVPPGHAVPPGDKVKSHKLSMGRYLGGHIPLWKGQAKSPLRTVPEGTRVCVSEGIEDGLSWACARPDEFVVAGVALANMASLAIPPQAGSLCFIGQNDPADSKAAAAFERAVKAQQDAGRHVEARFPPVGFKDFNDFLQGKGMVA